MADFESAPRKTEEIGTVAVDGRLRLSIAIATAGRAAVLADTLDHLALQLRVPATILVCPASTGDVDRQRAEASLGSAFSIVGGPRGLPAQRNALMTATDADILIFLDDDFLPAPDFVEEVARLFAEHPDVVVATGAVLADGILSRGIEFEEGRHILETAGPNNGGPLVDVYNAYGCNMVVRMRPVREHGLCFDEALPLYAWQEDVDFSRQLAPFGRIVKSPSLRGVHLGTKRSGRSPGKRLGYSQIANPVYLSRKGTVAWTHSLPQMARNLGANGLRSLAPEPWIDRRGRLLGNLLALGDLITGRLAPGRVVEMDS